METETLYHKLSEQGYKEFSLANQREPGRSVIDILKNKDNKAREVRSYRYKDLEPNGTRHKPDDIILFYK